jgi:hypothetical protein
MCPRISISPCPAASPWTRLSRAPSPTSGSDFHRRLCSPLVGPVRRHPRPSRLAAKTTVDLPGSSTLPFPSVPCSSTPPESPATFAPSGGLLWPSKFSTLSAPGWSHEAASLHWRDGPDVARSTLSPCRGLHAPTTRFPVGRLVPLAGAGISPARSARLILAHRKSPGYFLPRSRWRRCAGEGR